MLSFPIRPPNLSTHFVSHLPTTGSPGGAIAGRESAQFSTFLGSFEGLALRLSSCYSELATFSLFFSAFLGSFSTYLEYFATP
jgi:hypothetical protein